MDDDEADELEFAERLAAAREIMRAHFGIVEIVLGSKGRIVAKTDTAMAKRRTPRMHPKPVRREPRIYKSPFVENHDE